ncbi:hypothetical protein [Leptospira wolffii]|uniref:hypothetical protein n=1 Tax=Leptospira wolffii TaxID=409998 RepID=UPI0002DEA666|nr:hypothetical protein [Leptospira wolffii]EPG65097.1 putative lipoprotein [Leptospira wolffii serovar Khorat str. Khorat-H2]
MPFHNRILAVFLASFLSGCVSFYSNVYVNDKYKGDTESSVLILPFADRNEGTFSGYYPEAGKVAQGYMENELLNLGYQVRHLEGLVPPTSNRPESPDLFDLGRRSGAKVVVIGIVTSYVQGFATHPLSQRIEHVRFGFEAKAIQVETGTILWKVSAYKKDEGIFSYTSPVQNLAAEVIRSVAAEMRWKGAGVKEKSPQESRTGSQY